MTWDDEVQWGPLLLPGGTCTDTARSPAHGHTHASPHTPLPAAATRACPRACRQPRDVQPHACARPWLGSRPQCLPLALTCTGTTSPCPAGRGACAARCGARSTAPAPAPAPAARSAAGRWAGRSPLPRATRQCPAVPRAASGSTKPHSLPRCSPPKARALTSLQRGSGAAVLAAPCSRALAGGGRPARLAVAVPVVVAHLGG